MYENWMCNDFKLNRTVPKGRICSNHSVPSDIIDGVNACVS